MKLIIDNNELINYTNNMLKIFGGRDIPKDIIITAVEAMEQCFTSSNNKYYTNLCFTELHSVQYMIFLYHLSVALRMGNRPEDASRVYLLNRMLNSIDIYYEVNLPVVWGAEHPLGSVLGRAHYSNGLYFFQGVTVGGSGGCYPSLGKNILLYSNVSILGDTHIGDNVIVSSGVRILNKTISSNCLVFSSGSELVIIEKDESYMHQKMSHIWKPAYFESLGKV
jgi:serine O-acetyltransferase